MEYSKIRSIEIRNFMSLEHVKLVFDERGILNLKGYNNSGKSTVQRALAVCLMNMYVRSQTKYIRHGETYFRVVVSFDDGVDILRDKYINGQSLYEMYKDGECIFTTKEGSRLGKIEDVPKPIKDYLGLIDLEVGGYLNYQTRKEPLWLIETKGADNYYTLNEVLKTEEIAKANTLLNSDKNKLNSSIASIEAELQKSEMLLSNYDYISEGLIIALSEREQLARTIQGRHQSVIGLGGVLNSYNEISSAKDIPIIEKVSIGKYTDIKNVYEVLSKILDLSQKVTKKIDLIDNTRCREIYDIEGIINSILNLSTALDIPTAIEGVDLSYFSKKLRGLGDIMSDINRLQEAESRLNTILDEIAEVSKERDTLLKIAHDNGIDFVKCDNCGTLVRVGGNG